MIRLCLSLTTVLLTWQLAACSGSDPATPRPDSQPPSARQASEYMVSAAHPLAVQAGLDVLGRGGHAVDAAVAVQMVLGLVEAPESGIGGGGFLLLHTSASGTTTVFDGRETAPASATPERFRSLGMDWPLALAIPSGKSVGIPGLPAMLYQAHQQYGRLPWAELLQPAIALAEQSLPMPERLQRQIANDHSLWLFRDTRRYFRQQAAQTPPRLHNPALAKTLRLLADQGMQGFYQGPVAEQLLERVKDAPWGDAGWQAADLAHYRAIERDPVCAPYREWTLCSAGPPSSGGIAVLQILGMLAQFPLGEMGADDPQALHLLAEASRLAFADRNQYVGDPDFVTVPVAGLLDPDYLRQRAALINPERAMPVAHPGLPGQQVSLTEAPQRSESRERGTSHFTVLDGEGNLLALTSSNEAPFGSRMLSQGFVLNNQLTDFSFNPGSSDWPHPNAPAGGKRPRSSMAPILVLDAAGQPRLMLGSRGGSRIIGHVVKTLIAVLDWNMDIQDAIALPNRLERGRGLEIEAGTPLEALAPAMRAYGHRVRIEPMTSGVHGIERINGVWRGGADPRLDGEARGH
ncbi:MAG: gamma-glutamyltransferase [Gammaproteobacteria bacterium HGW-Gammaproteobacteria-11]|nr:MAG: gamma-glutamyltransferase [Gammaproteobacteria bacterium HGW-Gammaproteobacteria-11]